MIDDVDLYESPDRVWYAIEVEDPQSEREATVRILEDGTLLWSSRMLLRSLHPGGAGSVFFVIT